MARSDILLALVESGAGGDEIAFRRAAEALIAEEAAKQHGVLASQLRDALSRTARPPALPAARPYASSEPASELLYASHPQRRIADLVLPSAAREVLRDLVDEHHRRDLLRSYGIEPRHRVLLVGPPGGGKTTLAEALAAEVSVPLLTVRYEGLIGSFLGETAGRMADLFNAVRSQPCVLFFDEFDTVAKERGDVHETGEIKRVVSSLLLQIDKLPSHVIVIAATNHPELLDRAVWRRMQIRLELPNPTRAGRVEWLQAWTARNGFDFGLSERTVADKIGAVSFAELEEFAEDVERQAILAGPDRQLVRITDRVLRQWAVRQHAGEPS